MADLKHVRVTVGGAFLRRLAPRCGHPSILRRQIAAFALATVALWLAAGCDPGRGFPRSPIAGQEHLVDAVVAYDTSGDGKADYWQTPDRLGRIVLLRFDDDRDGRPDESVDLREIASSDVPHLIFALDGCPYDCVDRVWREGGFRLFYPPVRMASTFPAMTDVALSRIWRCGPNRAYQALYFDRRTGQLNSGSAAYLKAENSPWVSQMAYRCSFWWDANAYLTPSLVFGHEMRGICRTFRRVEAGTAVGYTVGTAGLGTRGGQPAIIDYLHTIDRICQRIVHDRRGRVKISILADHGHGLQRCERISFKDYLGERGFHLGKRLKGPNDVVTPEYGVVTYADFYTDRPDALSAALRSHEAVELVFHRHGSDVVARDRTGEALISRADGGYRYETIDGDPLRLGPIVESLRTAGKVTDDGVIDDRALLAATADHHYPDPLHRAWWALNGVTQAPADVIASLRSDCSHGGRFFNAMIGGVASTHGAIDRLSSMSFVLTMRGQLPPILRVEDALDYLDDAADLAQPTK